MNKTDSQIAKAYGFKPISDWSETEETNYANPHLLQDIIAQRDKAQAHADKLAEALKDLRETHVKQEQRETWNEKREHERDLEYESRETEEREAIGYWDTDEGAQ